jgi:hypothetical protein
MGISINNPLGSVIDLVKDGLDRFIPDKSQAAAAKATLDQLKESDDAKALDNDIKVQLAGLQVVSDEAKGESWLQRNWRPISALVFVGLVTSYWFGFTAPNLSEASIADLFSLVKICLGGYTVGRTVDKAMPHVATAISALTKK